MRAATGAAIAAALTMAGSARAMSVAEFQAKADALRAKGVMALFSSDIGVLKKEGAGAAQAWRGQIAPPGRPHNACPPPGPLKMDSDQFMAMLAAVPPPRRAATSVADAVTAGLNRRYPCPG